MINKNSGSQSSELNRNIDFYQMINKQAADFIGLENEFYIKENNIASRFDAECKKHI